MNQLAIKNEVGAIAVADPFSPEKFHTDAQSIIDSMFAKRDELAAAFSALGEIDEAPLEAVKACRKDLEEADALLKDYEKQFLDALLDLSGFKSVQVQMRGVKARIDPLSVRGKIAEMVTALKEREDAEKPAEPTHSYIIQMDVTDADFKRVRALLAKAGAAYRFVSVDNADGKADKFFKANGWKEA